MFLVIFSLLLDVAIFKWRGLVQQCVLVDLIHFAMYMLVPNEDSVYAVMPL